MSEAPARYNQLDPTVEARVDELIGRMSLAEKIGQLVQFSPFKPFDVEHMHQQMKRAEEAGELFVYVPEVRDDLEELIRAGRLGSVYGTPDTALINRYQRIAVEESRMGIPLIIGNDVIHGFRTIFPIPLAESCSWNPPLLEQAARVAAEEASAAGTDWIFAPIVDIARDPRWGRIAEGAGEDVFLAMVLAQARVRGFQSAGLASGRRIVACPKHYVAYGAAEAGRDYNTVDISERTLREIYLPPFKSAFDAGAGSVMSAFNEIGGVPASANQLTLETILRDEWGWPGVVVSDYESIRELIPHGVAADLAEAARLGLQAGVDMDMMSNAYGQHLEALVDSGALSEALVEQSVRRVLRLKLQLGLFERPYSDETLAGRIMLREDFRDLALEVARQSMVLLKNQGGLLPLEPGSQRIALIGPLADARRDQLGTWAIYGQPDDVESVLDGIRAMLPAGAALEHLPGCSVRGDEPAVIAAAVAAAQAADLVVMALGESEDMSGEAHSRTHLGLPGRQQELLDAVAATGKPLVVVLMTGRPLVIPRMAEQAGALLVAWHGGIRAGRAVAELLFGATNPCGRLTASWPRSEGQIPIYYAAKPTGRPATGSGTTQFFEPFKSTYLDESNAPLFPFGFGLSYTSFEYSDLQIEQPRLGLQDTLLVSARIANSGERAGAEVVQLYVRDLVASITRPVRELKGFQRITLQPGESQTVRFALPACELGFIGHDLRYAVEPGAFKLWVGPDSTGGLEGEFELVGES